MIVSGISPPFGRLSRSSGQVTNVLLTRLPLTNKIIADSVSSFDLHALDTPPAFILSQDQTLNEVLHVLADTEPLSVGIDVALPLSSERDVDHSHDQVVKASRERRPREGGDPVP